MPPRKIRVVEFIKTLDIGGAERHAIELAREITLGKDRDQFDVRVCAFFRVGSPTEKYWEQVLEQTGIPFFYAIDQTGKKALYQAYFEGVKSVFRKFKKEPVDVCHGHFQMGSLVSALLKWFGYSKIAVRTAHNHGRKEWNSGWTGDLKKILFTDWLYPFLFDAETGVSQAVVDELRNCPGGKISHRPTRLIQNGISRVFFTTRKPSEEADHENRLVIGSIGRLMTQKGYLYLIQSLPSICEKHPSAELWLIGEGNLREELEAEANRLGVADHVVFWGKRNDTRELLEKMDVFVLPSLWEGLPTVMLESFAIGAPVVATDIPGNRELIQDGVNGWLVPSADPQALAEKINWVLENPSRQESIIQCARDTAEQFSFERIANEYCSLYQDLLA